MRLTTLVVLIIAVAAALMLIVGIVRSEAQPAADPLAPVRCYERADDQGLEHGKAMRLCVGATSDAPALCYQAAEDDFAFSDLQAVRLCAQATSTAPAACARRLEDTTALSDIAIVRYCAAARYPVIELAGGGSPACIEAALDQTQLSDLLAARLCSGSESAAPVSCYLAAEDRLVTVFENDLVTLCAPVSALVEGYAVPVY